MAFMLIIILWSQRHPRPLDSDIPVRALHVPRLDSRTSLYWKNMYLQYAILMSHMDLFITRKSTDKQKNGVAPVSAVVRVGLSSTRVRFGLSSARGRPGIGSACGCNCSSGRFTSHWFRFACICSGLRFFCNRLLNR